MGLVLTERFLQLANSLQRGTEGFFLCAQEQIRISLHWQRLLLVLPRYY